MRAVAPAAPGVLVPGQPTEVRLEALDRLGRTYSSRERTLDTTLVTAEINYGSVSRVGGGLLVVPEVDRARVGAGSYTLRLRWADQRGFWESSFRPDWTARYGPEAPDVTDIALAIEGTFQRADGAVTAAPGDPLRLHVTVTDNTGRHYVAGAREPPAVPWQRVRVGLGPGLSPGDDPGTVVPDARGLTDGQRLELRVAYRDNDTAGASAAVVADYALIHGPMAREIVSVRASLSAPRVRPGSTLPLSIEVRDQRGYSYRLQQARPFLPVERVHCTGELITLDVARAQATAAASYRAVAGRHYSAACWIDGRDDLRGTLDVAPDLLGALLEQATGARPVAAAGAAGEHGERGQDGAGGGFMTGAGGRPGAAGTRGGNGQRGPRIRALIGGAVAFDHSTRFNVVVLEWGEQRRVLLLREGDALRVASVGGRGGRGGLGGTGGSGGIGRAGRGHQQGGTGGDGAPGGRGGDGGNGGDGGEVTVVAASQTLANEVAAASEGGAGGEPGSGGSGGNGGAGGIGGTYTEYVTFGTVRMPQFHTAPMGDSGVGGEAGEPGSPGAEGRPGAVRTVVDAGAVYAAIRRLRPPFLDMLILDDAPEIEPPPPPAGLGRAP